MNKNDNEMSLIKIPEYAYQISEEESLDVVNSDNASKVLKNTLLEEGLKRYIFNNFKIDYFIKSIDNFKYRSELFNLKYLKINKIVIAIFDSDIINKNLSISKRIFNSNLVSDLLFFVNSLNNEKFLVHGFINKNDLRKNLIVSSLNTYKFDKDVLSNLSTLEDAIQENTSDFNLFNESISDSQFLNNLRVFEKELDKNIIPEDFIYEVNYLNEDDYLELLSSEDLSKYYLELQVKLNKVYKNRNIIKINPKENLLVKLFLYNQSLSYKIKNLVSATSTPESKVTVFEFDIVNNTVRKVDIEIDSNIFDEESIVTIKGLDNYVEKPWLLFIDLSRKAIENMNLNSSEEIFLNWNNEEFLEKNSEIINRFCYRIGSKNETEVIDQDGYLDIKIDGIVSNDMHLFLAVIV